MVATIFALSAIPIVGLVGLAIDFGFATQARSQMILAADNAAMQAVTTAANEFTAGTTSFLADGIAAGKNWFAIQAGSVPNSVVTLPPTLTMTQSGGTFTSTLTYTVNVSTYFGRIFGIARITESGTARATITTNAYVNVTFLLDISSSMTIASTQTGIDKLNPLTQAFSNTNTLPASASSLVGLECSFACHWTNSNGTRSNGLNGYTNDYYGVARKNNVQLRFDVLQNAVAQGITQMINKELIANQFTVGVFTFNCTLNQVYPVGPTNTCGNPQTFNSQISSSNLSGASTAVTQIATPLTDDVGSGPTFNGTNFTGANGAMAKLTALLPNGGDGSTASSPQQSLIIVTDGLEDFGNRSIPTNEGPITPENCAAAKAKGITVYVIYTTYNADSSVLLFGNSALAPYLAGTASPGMVSSLQACASSSSAFAQASDGPAITTAFNAMLQAALRTGARFIQ